MKMPKQDSNRRNPFSPVYDLLSKVYATLTNVEPDSSDLGFEICHLKSRRACLRSGRVAPRSLLHRE
jgi:hypothetical protein